MRGGPVTAAERINSIDVVRGVALLGIAMMNVVSSGLPLAAFANPKVSGGATGLNLAVYFLQFILFEGKMRGLFSLMFGASAYLFTERNGPELYYRRLLWLMLFGLIHAYLIWAGDILYAYSLLGLVLFPLFTARPRNLLIAAGVMVVILTGQSVVDGIQLRNPSQRQDVMNANNPPAADLREERKTYSGSYFQVVGRRAERVLDLHSSPFYLGGLDMFAMMLVGIAFARTGVLSAEKPSRFYWRLMAGSAGVCLSLNAYAVWLSWRDGFGPFPSWFATITGPLAHAGLTIAYAAGIVLCCKHWRFAPIAAVGRTAFSNYILHSLIYGFVFYGYGLGLFGKLQRYQLCYLVLGMWAVSLIWSPLWLRRFRYGPLEWSWRCLTYWKRFETARGSGA